MGTQIELNDTLLLTTAQGFPSDILSYEKHSTSPVTLPTVENRLFHFQNKDGARIFHLDPVRVYLVHNLGGKWLHWGHALIQSQTISKFLAEDGSWDDEQWLASGSYKIVKILEPVYQKLFTMSESPAGKSFF